MLEYAGYEVLLHKETGTPGTYALVAQVVDIDGPSGKADPTETSHRDSRWRRYVAGMRDGGEVSFDLRFDPDNASHDPTVDGSAYKDFDDGLSANYKLIFPGQLATTTRDTTTCIFNAFTSKFGFKAAMSDALDASLTLKINGPLTWAHVAGS